MPALSSLRARMSWRDALGRLVSGEQYTVTHEAIPELQKAHAGLRERAALMREHAEAAPNQLSQQELSRLAEEDDGEAKRLAEALEALGAEVPHIVPVPPVGSLNHWERLVQDLEAHRGAMRRLREEAVHFAETVPQTGALFDRLCQLEEAHALRLRDLIARTDALALN
jgi:hypothetical protein